MRGEIEVRLKLDRCPFCGIECEYYTKGIKNMEKEPCGESIITEGITTHICDREKGHEGEHRCYKRHPFKVQGKTYEGCTVKWEPE